MDAILRAYFSFLKQLGPCPHPQQVSLVFSSSVASSPDMDFQMHELQEKFESFELAARVGQFSWCEQSPFRYICKIPTARHSS
jgi:hypothetical protein